MRNVILALALSISAVVHAQVSETIEVRVTNVDVVVTDRAGNPVHGLTAADFEVIEAGKPQPVSNFYEVRGTPATAATPAAPGQPDAPAAEPVIPPARRRVVVFVDTTTVHPHSRTQMLETFEKSLDRLMRDGDQAMLVLFDGVAGKVMTPLTADRTVLLARLSEVAKKGGGNFAMESQKSTIYEAAMTLLNDTEKPGTTDSVPSPHGSAPGEPSGGIGNGQMKRAELKLTLEQAYSMSRSQAQGFADQVWRRQGALIKSLSQTIADISTAEGKRVLLFIGGELSENPGTELIERIDNLYAPYFRNIQPASTRDPARSLAGDLRKLAEHANAAGVTMYLVDASDKRGINASEGTFAHVSVDSLSANDTQLAMTHVAALTGGISVPGGKQFQTAIDTIVRDLSSYYSLGYRSESQGTARIQVRVKNQPNLRVRTRQTFTAPRTRVAEVAAPAAPATAVPAAPAAAGSVPEITDDVVRTRLLASVHDDDVRGDFPISVSASQPQPQGNGRAQTDLTITFPSTMTLVEEEGALKGRVAVYLVTSNADGRTSKVSTDIKELKFPLGTRTQVEAQKTFTFTVPLLIGKGPVRVSVAVADQLAGTSGFAKTTVAAQ
jgi:VWFA-related protein